MNSGLSIHPRVIQVIQKQVAELIKRPPDSIQYALNESDILDIQADIHGPVGTPYHGGVFRCKLVLSSEFPKVPPKGYFLTKIFHPNVSEKGEICVNTLKKDWDPTNWSLQHVLEVIRCLLIVPFPESALNEEAGKVFMEDYEEYAQHARLITELYALPKVKATETVTCLQNL
jgi:ubiquitin-conjugating enzyme E2 S